MDGDWGTAVMVTVVYGGFLLVAFGLAKWVRDHRDLL